MSMLSAQIDELQKAAEYYDGSEVASIMRYAADTIWQLRDDLQRTNDENARLRSELESVGTAAYLYGRSDLKDEADTLRTQLADVTESMGRVEERCAKLRELVRGMYKAFMHGNCYRWCGFKEPCNHILDCKCQWYDRMRELGVDVP